MKKNRLNRKFKSTFIGIFVGFINGLLGAGGGSLLVPSLEKFLKVEEHQAHATAISIILPLSIISSIIYVRSDVVDWNVLLYVAIGGVIGGIVGAKFLGRISSKWLHVVFGFVMIIAAIRMIIG